MADLKFIFSQLRCAERKKNAPDRVEHSVDTSKREVLPGDRERIKEREIPFFYHHKIRAPKYEYF
jgi:hypothetical protein